MFMSVLSFITKGCIFNDLDVAAGVFRRIVFLSSTLKLQRIVREGQILTRQFAESV